MAKQYRFVFKPNSLLLVLARELRNLGLQAQFTKEQFIEAYEMYAKETYNQNTPNLRDYAQGQFTQLLDDGNMVVTE